jgi:NAD(P)H-dependent FMN reductase
MQILGICGSLRAASTNQRLLAAAQTLMPHGVDRSLFNPRPQDLDAIRAELGLPADAYVVGIVAAK